MSMSKLCAGGLPDGYGYVVLTVVGSEFLNIWLAMNVVKAREKYDVKYPKLYSEDNEQFNCIQRAHQNFLEYQPQFLSMVIISGLMTPKFAAAAGAMYLAGRVLYAKGYYTGDPKNRRWGGIPLHGAQMCLLLGTLHCAGQLFGFRHEGWWFKHV